MINFDKFLFFVYIAQKKHKVFYISHKHKNLVLLQPVCFHTDSAVNALSCAE